MDVYDVNEDLVKALVHFKKIEICSQEFSKIQENFAKVNYVEDLLRNYQQFSKLDLKINLRTSKNNERAIKYRQEGNEYFSLKKKDYHKALELYNKSICFSEACSENISIGYANRSAILFEWKMYDRCLDNIKLAREANYPERLVHKLDKREKDCLELMKTESPQECKDENTYFSELSYNPHPVVPFITECLDMKSDNDSGRYIYTKQDLHPGDLVAMEEPFCSILLPLLKYTRCANCKKENNYTLIPCPHCTTAMFCSESCREEALVSFHKYECPVIDFLFQFFNKIHLIALRVTLIAIHLFPSVEECMDFCENERNLNQNSFTLDYENFSKREHYRAIHGLVTNQEKRVVSDLFQRAVITAVLKRYLIENTPLKELLNKQEKVDFFTGLLYRHLQTSSSNMHSINLIDSKALKDDQTFASAAYAFGSLMNHSCAPNVVRIFRGTTVLLFIIRSIPANGILYDNYGYHYATHPKRSRQQNLEIQYRFTCKCEACENNYPLYNDLPSPSEVPEEISADDICKLMKYDRSFALENLERYCNFLKKYSKYFPCVQISSVEESLKMALNIIVDAIPLRLKYK